MSKRKRWPASSMSSYIGMLVLAIGLAGCGGGVSTSLAEPPVPNNPVARIASINPNAPFVNDAVSFDAEGGGAGISFGWTFGDGATAQGQQATHAYAHAGVYDVQMTVTDLNGASATATSRVAVAAVPVLPSTPEILLAQRTTSQLATVPIALVAVATDANGGPLTYTWNFGDATTANGQSAHHTFATAGAYTVSVTATNSEGGQATGTTTLVVRDPVQPPPVIPPLENPSIQGPTQVPAASPATFTGSAVSGSSSALTFTWDFGDGSPVATGQTVTHVFNGTSGQRAVTMTVTDTHGQTAVATTTVTVVPPLPPFNVVIEGPLEVMVGAKVEFAIRFENPAGNTVSYAWDFGDGSTSSLAAPTHSYSQAGAYTVKVTVTDTVAGSATGTMTINVAQSTSLIGLRCLGSEPGAGWCQGPTLPIPPTSLNGIAFANSQTGWVVGQNGGIAKSTDGGVDWTVQRAGGSALLGVSAVDVKHAWAVGASDVLLTADGGATWQTVSVGAPFGLSSIKFVDAKHGWAVGQQEGIVATTDGGQTWSVQNRNSANPALQSVDFADVNHGWAVGDGGYILGTTDGGQTWNKLYQSPQWAVFKRVSFVDASNGFVVGTSGAVLKTTDGGATWQTAATPGGTGATLVAAKFVTPATGWVASDSGIIFRTDDGGSTWRKQSAPPEASGMGSIEALNSSNVWFVTAGGGYALSVTGGD